MVVAFEAHLDYIRCLAVHPTLPVVFTGSDDMTIKSWGWGKSCKCANVSPLICNAYDSLRLLLS
jgi:coatomer subunit beta'